jgi:3,4-dihydroxy 2-butanone 4-phosphate synthase/GTP cyclohydrolase II
LRNGSFVVVADDEGRENEGDLICAAGNITPAMVNFMAREARGLICVAVTAERAKQLDLHPMVVDNTDPHQTAFTVSVDAGPEFGVTTGISASDRATTIQRLASDNAVPKDFRRPGHIFPLTAQQGAVLRRVGPHRSCHRPDTTGWFGRDGRNLRNHE